MHFCRTPIFCALYFAITGFVSAQSAPPATAPAAAPTKPWYVQSRYRHESVDDEAFTRDAQADTLRVRAGYTFNFGSGWSSLIEGEGVAELNDKFNSGANRQTQFPVVLDPRSLEVNQAWVDWNSPTWGMRIGRQRINLDNQRFIGSGGWRQNEQTIDAAQLRWKSSNAANLTDVQLFLLGTIHRSAGDNAVMPLARERKLDGKLLRVQQNISTGSLVGYGYFIEDRDVRQDSTRTLGLRWSSAWPLAVDPWKFGVTLEAAQQEVYAAATGGDTRYLLVEPRIERGPLIFRFGWERLGAATGRAFQTPLATLHAFNGWADKFLVTPLAGLVDTYASAQGGFSIADKPATWQVKAHDFKSDDGADYGTEWDASFGLTVRPGLMLLAKAADYNSDGFARDTTKLWFQAEWNF